MNERQQMQTAGGAQGETLTPDAGGGDGPDGSPPVNIPAGDIQFFDNFLPPLEDGTYQITVTQEVNKVVAPGTTTPLTQPYVRQQYFTVRGPRFTLNASEVYSVFPPPNSLTDYAGVLPHVVLNERTLPWERTLDGTTSGAKNPPPWLALLLFRADDIIVDSPPLGAGGGGSTKTQLMPLSEVINLPTDGPILGPQNIVLGPGEEVSPPGGDCLVIDILPQTFLAVAPQLAELPLLAHCREVNTGNKEILGIDADGWFSVVVGNRTAVCEPQSPGGAGTLNIAHLVSLEGLQDYLPTAAGANPVPQNVERVRLVSLASWSFTCLPSGLNFANLMKNLSVGTMRLSGECSPPNFFAPAPSPPGDAGPIVQGAFQLGYVPLNYTTMQGEQTVAWCRGPFVPFATQRADRSPFKSADEAKIYDRKTGMFDLSLAVAWQIGRLLALADKEFSVALLNWQREVNYLINLIFQQGRTVEKFGNALNLPDEAARSPVVNRHLIRRAFVSYLKTTFAERVAPAGPGAAPLLGAGRDPTGIRGRLHEMPGLLSQEEVEELLAAGEDPAHALRWKNRGG